MSGPDAIPAPESTDPVSLGRSIVERCLALGFMSAGVCEARASDRAGDLRAWLAAGKHGEMDWLAADAHVRLDPALKMPGVRSVIMVADRYAPRARSDAHPPTPADGRIARYARGLDYHRHMKRRLHRLCDGLVREHPGALFRAFVDTAPVLEREHAARAGLGWVGKHTLLIHPRHGSWFLLGGILTTLDLRPDPNAEPGDGGPVADHCGACTRCIDACPTQAITPYSVDARRCISYLTIEHRSPVDPALASAAGDWLFGCDICQEVCPHNAPRQSAIAAPIDPAYAPRRASFDLLAVLGWTRHQRSATLGPTALKRATLDVFKRNALLAAANALNRTHEWSPLRKRVDSSPLPASDSALPPDVRAALIARITDLAWDVKEPPLVRDTARAVLTSLPTQAFPRPDRGEGL